MNIFKILRFVIDTRNWGFYWSKQIKWGVFFFGGEWVGGARSEERRVGKEC